MSEEAVERPCAEIGAEIGAETAVEMSLEGIYHWLTFLPSKVRADRPAATSYFGLFTDGTLKLRNLACRRRDTPEFIRRVQVELLEVISQGRTLNERLALEAKAVTLLQERIGQLMRGEVAADELALNRRLTRDLEAYRVQTRAATTAKQLSQAGVKLHPGERVRYVITNAQGKSPGSRVRESEVAPGSSYDIEEYVKFLKLAAGEVLNSFRRPLPSGDGQADRWLPFGVEGLGGA